MFLVGGNFGTLYIISSAKISASDKTGAFFYEKALVEQGFGCYISDTSPSDSMTKLAEVVTCKMTSNPRIAFL